MSIKDYLVKEQGFNPYNSEGTQRLTGCTWSMFRRTKIETDKECLCNDKPPQIGVYFYSVELQGRTHKSYKVEVVQENDLGWINFEYYGVDEDHLIKNFGKIERSLIKAWEVSWYEEGLKRNKLDLIQELCNRSRGEIHWMVDDFIKEIENIID